MKASVVLSYASNVQRKLSVFLLFKSALCQVKLCLFVMIWCCRCVANSWRQWLSQCQPYCCPVLSCALSSSTVGSRTDRMYCSIHLITYSHCSLYCCAGCRHTAILGLLSLEEDLTSTQLGSFACELIPFFRCLELTRVKLSPVLFCLSMEGWPSWVSPGILIQYLWTVTHLVQN